MSCMSLVSLIIYVIYYLINLHILHNVLIVPLCNTFHSIMEVNDYHIQILRNLLHRRKIGKSHTHREQALGRLLQEDGKKANKALDELIKQGFIINKPTSYGNQVSLNPKRLKDIIDMTK